MTIISATDYFERLRLGPVAFESLVRSRSRSRPLSLEEELAVRDKRIEELRSGVIWQAPAAPAAIPPARAKPAWSAKRPTQTTDEFPWSVVLRSQATRPFEIRLEGDASWTILKEIRHIAGERLETGGYLWSREHPRPHVADIVYVTGSGMPGQLHGPNSLKLGRAEDTRAQMPEWLRPEELVAAGCFHLHPSRDPRPSTTDINSWAARLYLADRSHSWTWPSIIVIPDGPGQQFFGYVTRRERPGVYTTEPAKVEGRYVA